MLHALKGKEYGLVLHLVCKVYIKLGVNGVVIIVRPILEVDALEMKNLCSCT